MNDDERAICDMVDRWMAASAAGTGLLRRCVPRNDSGTATVAPDAPAMPVYAARAGASRARDSQCQAISDSATTTGGTTVRFSAAQPADACTAPE